MLSRSWFSSTVFVHIVIRWSTEETNTESDTFDGRVPAIYPSQCLSLTFVCPGPAETIGGTQEINMTDIGAKVEAKLQTDAALVAVQNANTATRWQSAKVPKMFTGSSSSADSTTAAELGATGHPADGAASLDGQPAGAIVPADKGKGSAPVKPVRARGAPKARGGRGRGGRGS